MADDRLLNDAFPRSSRYSPDWVIAGACGGANVLWLAEWLAGAMDLAPGLRVLDLGCGTALSSIFLHREFGVEVWAVDLWNGASANLRRVRDAGVEGGVFPIHADARDLPFAAEFFDAIVCLDSIYYYGTDDSFIGNLARFVKVGGQVAIAGAALMEEIEGDVPEHLRGWWTPDLWSLHSAGWWARHWARSGAVEVERADTMPDGWRHWLQWHRTGFPDNLAEIEALEADRGRHLGYARVVARRVAAELEPPLRSLPESYTRVPMLRDDGPPAGGDR